MSRPFSYNDEHFTVIGNLLIIHIPFSGTTTLNQVICPIPPEISKRVPYKGFIANYNRSPYSPIPSVQLFIDNNILISNSGNFTKGQFFAITNLKDI